MAVFLLTGEIQNTPFESPIVLISMRLWLLGSRGMHVESRSSRRESLIVLVHETIVGTGGGPHLCWGDADFFVWVSELARIG